VAYSGGGSPARVIPAPAGGIVYTGGGSPVKSVPVPAGGVVYGGLLPTISGAFCSVPVPADGVVYGGTPGVVTADEPTILTGYNIRPGAGGVAYGGPLPVASFVVQVPVGGVEYGGPLPAASVTRKIAVPAGGVEYGGQTPWVYWAVLPGAQYHTVYRCTLTGTTDLELPISTFQARLRDGTPAYLQVTVPNGSAYIDEVQARTTGEIVVEKGLQFASGYTQYEELSRVDFDSLAYGRGPFNYTMTLSGNKTTTNTAPKTVTLTDVSGVSLQANGNRRVRCGVDFFARPGDTVEWESTSMTAGLITITVGRGTAYTDITESET
jgi:hypothetical protein